MCADAGRGGLEVAGTVKWSSGGSKDCFVVCALFHELGDVLNDLRGEMHMDKGVIAFGVDVQFSEDGIKPFDGLSATARSRARQVGWAWHRQ